MSEPSCLTCRWCDASDEGIYSLLCRRFPPKADYEWPHVFPAHWCGEHKLAAEAERDKRDREMRKMAVKLS